MCDSEKSMMSARENSLRVTGYIGCFGLMYDIMIILTITGPLLYPLLTQTGSGFRRHDTIIAVSPVIFVSGAKAYRSWSCDPFFFL